MIRMRLVVLILLCFAGSQLFSQSDLMVKGNSSELYLMHTVAPKETWYSLGRMYNLPPKELAAFNKLRIDQPLNIAQQLKVPLTATNFIQASNSSAGTSLIPLYHIVQEREWMYRISVNHNKVPIENLEKWNNINRDNAVAGTKLIVGFLKVDPAQSPLAGTGAQPSAPAPVTPPVVKNDPDYSDGRKQTVPRETPKTQTVTEEKTIPSPVSSTEPNSAIAADFKGGYFKNQYDERGKTVSGVSGIFKSTSGWNDGKYYALMNKVPVGTIVKVKFPSTNKTVYAKVLGELPEMRESQGLTIRLSDAAVSELGAGNTKFTVDVAY